MYRTADISLLGEPNAHDLRLIARRAAPKRWHRTCCMVAWRAEHGIRAPEYCLGEFDTNNRTKLTCSYECGCDHHRVHIVERRQARAGSGAQSPCARP